jgi:hypothetical protein
MLFHNLRFLILLQYIRHALPLVRVEIARHIVASEGIKNLAARAALTAPLAEAQPERFGHDSGFVPHLVIKKNAAIDQRTVFHIDALHFPVYLISAILASCSSVPLKLIIIADSDVMMKNPDINLGWRI